MARTGIKYSWRLPELDGKLQDKGVSWGAIGTPDDTLSDEPYGGNLQWSSIVF